MNAQSRTNDNAWSDLDLEAFHDGELDGAAAAALGEALRTDGALRARLAAVVGVDAAVRRLVLARVDADAGVSASDRPGASGRSTASDRSVASVEAIEGNHIGKPSRPAGRWRMPVALAAAVCVVGGVVMLLTLREEAGSGGGRVGTPSASTDRSGTTTIATESAPGVPILAALAGPTGPLDVASAGDDRASGGRSSTPLTRVLLSVPVRGPRLAREPAPGATGIDGVDGALQAADPAQIAREMEAASLAERDAAYMAMGRAIRSAMAATDYLDRLDEQEQVRVCRLWAEDPSLRPVVFARLAALRQRGGDVRQEVDRVASDLGARSEFVPWLRSHGLM